MSSHYPIYIYCIAPLEQIRGAIDQWKSPSVGNGDNTVRIIEHNDLAAIVSDTQQVQHELTRKNLMAHQKVLEETMSYADILPAAFGTTAQSEADIVEKLLEREADNLRDHLKYIHNRVEFSLSAEWIDNRMFDEIAVEYEDVRALRDSLAQHPADATYFERIQLGQMIEAAMADKQERELMAILEVLEPYTVDIRLNKNVTDSMLMNASVLVQNAMRNDFDAAVDQLGSEREGRMTFRLVGPLPPASFVDLRISWEDEPNGVAF